MSLKASLSLFWRVYSPQKGCFALVKAMFRDAWDIRLGKTTEDSKGIKANIKQLEKQV